MAEPDEDPERSVDLALVEAIEEVLREEAERDDRIVRRARADRLLWFTLGAAAALVVVLLISVIVLVVT